MKRYWILLFLINFLQAGIAQIPPSSFSFDHLTVDDGLSYSTVHDLLEDDLGMIWAGTRFGLNCFDGYEFKVFLPDVKNPYAIKSQSILCLSNDEKGNIWIGHLNGGVSVLERSTGRFLRFPFKENTSFNWNTITIRKIFRDPLGNIWFGTYGAGTIVFDSAYNQIAHFCTTCLPDNRKISNDFVFDFKADPDGRIWIGMAGRGITLFDWKTKTLQVIHGTDNADMDGFSKSICMGQGSSIWVGTEGSGLYEIDRKKLTVTRRFEPSNSPLSHLIITDILPDRNGNIWIGTDGGGLNRYNPSTDSWQHFSYQPDFLNSINSDAVYSLMFDSSDNLWIGTFNGGINLHKVISPPFVIERQYALENAEGLRSVLCVDQDTSDTVWMGTDGGGLFQLNVKESPVKLTSVEKSSLYPTGLKVITSLVVRPDGNIWLGTFAQGLYLYNKSKGIIKEYQHHPEDAASLSHNNVWDLELAEDGGLWIATLGGGVCHLSPGQMHFERFLPEPQNPNSISGTQIVDILLDEVHHWLWIASENAGLSRIDLSSTPFVISQYHHDPDDTLSLASEKLRCLFKDDEGTLWIGTENAGLSYYNISHNTFHTYSTDHGLPSNMINSIVQDVKGNVWITSQAGIVRWDQSHNQFIKVGSEPYLENNQYNPRAAMQLHDGRLLLGSMNGYSILMPDRVSENVIAPVVVFTGLSLSNETIPIGEHNWRSVLSGPLNDPATEVRLSYQDKGIRFDFTAPDYIQPDKNLFAYRLIDFDTTWRLVGPEQRFATYSALPGGQYVLQVKAANSNGTWSTNIRELKIYVSSPFWKTWWFLAGSGAIGIILVIGVLRFLLQRQRSHFRQETLRAEQEILRLQNENLEKDILNKQAQLSASVLQSAHKNQFLEDLKNQIRKMEWNESVDRHHELHRLSRSIDSEISQKDYWDQFQLTFNQVHQDFVHTLHNRNPGLTTNDSRLCCFIRMGFSNAEIASVLNITVNGVEQSKYRLKKKLALDRDASVNDYIANL
ncbi:MAG TPA: two-component regulator propeller domain-containing protein [Saprospiraceae bacterium]|nr:two-component regulator propeller domain-containing protein [Saprospiraceae bacterium]